MKNLSCILLIALVCAAPPVFAQTPAAAPGPVVPVPVKKAWLIRLIPPRPTFDKDMTDAEGALMEQHFLYWKGMFEKGICLFGGPVLDPKGVYGVIVVAATSDDEARDLGAADPSVKAGLNRIEVAEMKIAFFQKTH